jgi:hypothetical protein
VNVVSWPFRFSGRNVKPVVTVVTPVFRLAVIMVPY